MKIKFKINSKKKSTNIPFAWLLPIRFPTLNKNFKIKFLFFKIYIKIPIKSNFSIIKFSETTLIKLLLSHFPLKLNNMSKLEHFLKLLNF